MIIKSFQTLKILAHIDKIWDQNKEEIIRKDQLKPEYEKVKILDDWERDIKHLKGELLEKLVNPQHQSHRDLAIVSHNKKEIIITMNCGSVFQGEFICCPTGSVQYKEMI
tara:strand:- start:2189 stop:2518 length:330 start_codon:yes stop_codon:yes gene_type:complete